jgi:hypothetical protein
MRLSRWQRAGEIEIKPEDSEQCVQQAGSHPAQERNSKQAACERTLLRQCALREDTRKGGATEEMGSHIARCARRTARHQHIRQTGRNCQCYYASQSGENAEESEQEGDSVNDAQLSALSQSGRSEQRLPAVRLVEHNNRHSKREVHRTR